MRGATPLLARWRSIWAFRDLSTLLRSSRCDPHAARKLLSQLRLRSVGHVCDGVALLSIPLVSEAEGGRFFVHVRTNGAWVHERAQGIAVYSYWDEHPGFLVLGVAQGRVRN